MCYTSGARAHIWQKYTNGAIRKKRWKNKAEKRAEKTIPAAGAARGEKGKWERKKGKQSSNRNANKKWEMPRLYPTKWKVLFNIIVPCLPKTKRFPKLSSFFSFCTVRLTLSLFFFVKANRTHHHEPPRWYCVLLKAKTKIHISSLCNNFLHIMWRSFW